MEWRPTMGLKILILILLSSCANHIYLTPRYCDTKATMEPMKGEGEIISKREWMVLQTEGPKVIEWRNLLKEKNRDCKSLNNVSIIVETQFLDALLTVVPFVSSKVITIQNE